ncbi:hypothetical protein [Sphingomonas sp. PB1R3]|uniref:hypothetical protein n=1 Tax=Sphingomonas flavida TaxID=3096154 RepID=UPI002FC9E921
MDEIARIQGETPFIPTSVNKTSNHADLGKGHNPRFPGNMTDDELEARLKELRSAPDAKGDARITQIEDEIARREEQKKATNPGKNVR